MKERFSKKYRARRGTALVLAIFTSAVLTVLAVSLVEVVRVEIIASRSSLDRLQARYLAKAGFNLARSLLMYEDEQEVDGPEDKWFALQYEPPLQLGEGACRMAVVDACSLINVNTAEEQTLSTIIGDPVIAQAIVAYREENGPFRSLGEMVQAAGVAEEDSAKWAESLTVVSLERNLSASGEQRVNINKAEPSEISRILGLSLYDSQSILRYRRQQPEERIRSVGELLRVPIARPMIKEILDKVSVSDEKYLDGRVNLNTAPREVLLALPGATPQFVDTLIARRQEKEGALRSPGDLLGFPGVSDEAIISLSAVACTKSSTFVIEASAGLEDKPVRRTVQGIVMRQPGPIAPIISGWREVSRPVFIPVEKREGG